MDSAIEKISLAKKALIEAKTLSEVLELRDVAVAAHAYATARNANETAQMAVEIKLRAERKAGQFLKEDPLLGKGKSDRLSYLNVHRKESSRWQLMAKLSEERFEEFMSDVPNKTQSALLRLAKGVHVGHSTGEFEWYTPEKYAEAARKVMGVIDLDPASCEEANRIIKAEKYFTIEDNGLLQEWHGNVWLNPPYKQPLVTEFCDLLVDHYYNGKISQACVLVNNATETGFYQNMMRKCEAICFIAGRVKFADANGNPSGTPLQGQTILYFGDNVRVFADVFSEFGVVLYA